MHFVDKVQAQGEKQRKIPVPKKFWVDFPLDSWVKVSLLNDESIFFVDIIQEQGKIQRRIPLPQKFWDLFEIGAIIRVDVIHKGGKTK
ncbi:hypothetical protein COV12_02205 [Candidatus Woesearchaeota archaeon CG10_big_fil_rev_8_21_14_0_10_32_24]|nr:MAG: hypothetical protein COV12_02205 [Candidatus Woesearchaeota archaeon CG10_big_fil_rev_8_21_14_0_10_32_24]